jgi:hypothetical protein
MSRSAILNIVSTTSALWFAPPKEPEAGAAADGSPAQAPSSTVGRPRRSQTGAAARVAEDARCSNRRTAVKAAKF